MSDSYSLDMAALAKELDSLRNDREACSVCFGCIYIHEGRTYHGISAEKADQDDRDLDGMHQAKTNLTEAEAERLSELEDLEKRLAQLEGCVGNKDFSIASIEVPVISEGGFQKFVTECAEEEADAISPDVQKMNAWRHIDWNAMAEESRADYAEFEFEGRTWLYSQ